MKGDKRKEITLPEETFKWIEKNSLRVARLKPRGYIEKVVIDHVEKMKLKNNVKVN